MKLILKSIKLTSIKSCTSLIQKLNNLFYPPEKRNNSFKPKGTTETILLIRKELKVANCPVLRINVSPLNLPETIWAN